MGRDNIPSHFHFAKGCEVMSKLQKSAYNYALIVPGIALYSIFFILPAIAGLVLSYANVHTFNIQEITFAGLQNYINIFTDNSLKIAIKNSLIFGVVTTVFKVLLGMILALFLSSKLRTTNFLRTTFFLPAVLNSVSVGLIFTAMMHPSTGIINGFLKMVGLGGLAQNWLTNPQLAIFSVANIEVWKWTGFTMVILLAGLQSIPQSYYEVADIEGTTGFQKFRYVTFPLIMPAFTNALVVNMIGGLKAFDIVQAVTQGGPGSATEVLGTLVYKSFGSGRYGEGCAASIILCVIVLVIVMPTFKYFSGKEVEV